MRCVCVAAMALSLAVPSVVAGQTALSSPIQGVPSTTLWPELAVAPTLALKTHVPLTPDTSTARRPPPNVFVTLAGASLGSFGGLIGGAYAGVVLTDHGHGEYDGLVGALVGAGFGAVLGSAVLGASMSGAPASEVFEDAFAGSFIGLMAGAAGALAGGLTRHPAGAFSGFALAHGAATTFAVMNSDYFRE